MNILDAIAPIWKVLLVGLLLGAGLPAIFALGLRSLAGGSASAGSAPASARPLGVLGAGLAFLVVVLAVAFGIAVLIGGTSVLSTVGLG